MRRLAEALGDAERQIKAMRRQSEAAYRAGRLREAVEEGQRAAALARQIGRSDLEADSLTQIASAAFRLGESTLANEATREALRLYRASGQRAGEVLNLSRLSYTAHLNGQNEDAQALTKEALALVREVGDPALEAQIFNTAGLIATDSTQSRLYWEQALSLYRLVGDRERQATLYNNVAGVLTQWGLSRKAQAYAQRAVQLTRETADVASLPTFLDTLARSYRKSSCPCLRQNRRDIGHKMPHQFVAGILQGCTESTREHQAETRCSLLHISHMMLRSQHSQTSQLGKVHTPTSC
jgi:tetratricopeptide (TPR) repeat protein